jgi:hypothetical protein
MPRHTHSGDMFRCLHCWMHAQSSTVKTAGSLCSSGSFGFVFLCGEWGDFERDRETGSAGATGKRLHPGITPRALLEVIDFGGGKASTVANEGPTPRSVHVLLLNHKFHIHNLQTHDHAGAKKLFEARNLGAP